MEFMIENYRLRIAEDGKIERYYEYKTKPDCWKEILFGVVNSYLVKGFRFNQSRKQTLVSLHRLVYYAYNQDWDIWDTNQKIDHIDRNKRNNKIGNLRLVTNQQNNFNRSFKGYYFDKSRNKFRASITIDKKKIHIGYYDTAEEASKAYLEAKEEHHTIP